MEFGPGGEADEAYFNTHRPELEQVIAVAMENVIAARPSDPARCLGRFLLGEEMMDQPSPTGAAHTGVEAHDSWTLTAWLDSIGLSQAIASCIEAQLGLPPNCGASSSPR